VGLREDEIERISVCGINACGTDGAVRKHHLK